MIYMESSYEILRNGGVGVLRTDTLYGIVCSALDRTAVERVYELKGRDFDKPCIILIGDMSDLDRFPLAINEYQRAFMEEHWPAPLSLIVSLDPDADEGYTYLHCNTHSLSFRIPNDAKLRTLLSQTGPLIAPSANHQGKQPATSIKEARMYFPHIDVYIDGGVVRETSASTVVRLERDGYTILREGAYIFNS